MKLKQRGVTIVELMVAIAVLGVAASVMVIGTNLLRWVQRQVVLGEVQREAQLQLYAITRDIRNAQQIIYISSDTLTLRSFNFHMAPPGQSGFDTAAGASPDLFNLTRMGTVTYRYQETGTLNYLRRTEVFNNVSKEQRFLRNMLITPTETNFIFAALPIGTLPPYDSVRIVLRIGRGFFREAQRDYTAEAQVRSRD